MTGPASEPAQTPARIEVEAYVWPEVAPGSDLVALVAGSTRLADGDVVVLTSKAVSKSQGLVVEGDRAVLIAQDTTRVVARRGPTVIAETRHGLVLAAAGVDASNVPPGSVVALPPDSDSSARQLRERLYEVTDCNVAVLVTDTAGRAWRNGQTDMAVGCAGLLPMVDMAGSLDSHANLLEVTAPAVADELAAAADLVKGKATGRPLAVVRGLAAWVLPAGEHGDGARTLVRPADDDLFGLGSREAVRAAVLRRDEEALAHFPRRIGSDADPFEGLACDHPAVRLICSPRPDDSGSPGWLVQVDLLAGAGPDAWLEAGRLLEKVDALAAANRLRSEPVSAADDHDDPEASAPVWVKVARTHWFVA